MSTNGLPELRMKITPPLLGCLLALSLAAAVPPEPTAFEVRLVLDSASADTEQLTFIHQRTIAGQAVEERLHVQKEPLLDRSAVKSAEVQRSSVTGTPEIQVAFTERGAKRFAEVTRQHIGQRLAIVIDGKVYAAPKVATEILSGKAVISGSFTEQEATQLARRLSRAATK